MKGNGLMIRDTDAVTKNSRTAMFIKVTMRKGKLMVKVYLHGFMGKSTMVSGSMELKKDMESGRAQAGNPI